MKVRFASSKERSPDQENGLKVLYGPSRRVAYKLRWYLILLLVGAAASGLSGGLHFLTVGVWRRTVDRLVAAPRSVIQKWMALHLLLRFAGYVLLLQILLLALSTLRI